jgi:hypothetical protein
MADQLDRTAVQHFGSDGREFRTVGEAFDIQLPFNQVAGARQQTADRLEGVIDAASVFDQFASPVICGDHTPPTINLSPWITIAEVLH